MNEITLLNEILSEFGIDYKASLNELSEMELERVLFVLLWQKEHNNTNVTLAKKIVNKLYSKEVAEFYSEAIDYMDEKKNIDELINKYANSEYSNEIFCRTGEKPFWDIESKILIKRGYPRVKNVLSQMFLWFQDLNWPGATEISQLLSSIDKKVVIPHLEEVAMIAKEEKDDEWLYFLDEFMIKNKYKKEDFKNKDIYDLLEKYTDI